MINTYAWEFPGFLNFKFLNFFVYTTLLVPKQPNSIKNVVHCGALQSRRASSDLFSFFIHPVYSLRNIENCTQLNILKKF